jgi:hypothetical protein
MMIKLVIWLNLNAQSVCAYQIWYFLIPWCSACWEDFRDYKFVFFGLIELKIWFKQFNRRFDSVLKIDSNLTHKIWIIIVLLDSRCSKDSNGILFVIFGHRKQKIWILQDWIEFWFKILFDFLFYIGGRHVSVPDWGIPVRSDTQRGALDQMDLSGLDLLIPIR